jgi:hypothetical protein
MLERYYLQKNRSIKNEAGEYLLSSKVNSPFITGMEFPFTDPRKSTG